MTFEEAAAAARVMFEEKVGTLARAQDAAETAQAEASIAAIREVQR